MPQYRHQDWPITAVLATELTRRQLLARFTALAAAARVSASWAAPGRGAAQDAESAPPDVDPTRLQALVDLSRTLCGGGTVDQGRAAMLLRLVDSDPDFTAGLDQLLGTPPVAGQDLPSAEAQTAAQAILLYWYAGSFAAAPVSDRATAYYQLTAWQAMYTFPHSVCRGFGMWADPPPTAPLVAGA